jgi:RNA polymerase sigma factor (TIGR02999 family)
MSDVTQILGQIESGDGQAAEKLLPLVYDELRRLAAAKMAQENPGQTLQATALVHEAYIRLVDVEKVQHWNSRGHFVSAAAEAMRRILVENARKKQSLKRGRGIRRRELIETFVGDLDLSEDMLTLDEALTGLAERDPDSAELAKLRIFAGLSTEEAAPIVGLSPRSATRRWAYARAWLIREIQGP